MREGRDRSPRLFGNVKAMQLLALNRSTMPSAGTVLLPPFIASNEFGYPICLRSGERPDGNAVTPSLLVTWGRSSITWEGHQHQGV